MNAARMRLAPKAPAGRPRNTRQRGPAMILGIGSDLIDIRRIEKSLERHGERFVERIFTEIEQARAEGRAQPRRHLRQALRQPRKPAPRRWAAAFPKACSGATWAWSTLPSGKPTMHLTGGAAEKLERLPPPDHRAVIHLTITDEFPIAQAFVIIEAAYR